MNSLKGPLLAFFFAIFLFGVSRISKDTSIIREVSVEGTLLICVHEKQRPTVDEVIAVREAKSFVEKHKLKGWLVVDRDDPNWQPLIEEAVKRQIDPPLLAAAVVENGSVSSLKKIVKWEKGLEDILR
jgi:hypothetical protein